VEQLLKRMRPVAQPRKRLRVAEPGSPDTKLVGRRTEETLRPGKQQTTRARSADVYSPPRMIRDNKDGAPILNPMAHFQSAVDIAPTHGATGAQVILTQ
jgi:hypothetical protein